MTGNRAEALAAAGRRGEAIRLLEAGARARDPDALFMLAAWRLTGQNLPRDLGQARLLFAHAASAGHTDALAITIAFAANGTGATPDWPEAMRLLSHFAATDAAAADQSRLIAAMHLTLDGAPVQVPTGERLSASPDLQQFRALFSQAECDYLCQLAMPLLEPATIVDPRSGRHIPDPVRKSDVAAFPLVIENPVVRALNRRLAAASGTDVAQGEPLQIISYRPGQRYHAHSDAFVGAANQRILTMLIYLNDDYTGGETQFVPAGPIVKGVCGDAILFRNTDKAGIADPAARHSGLPVIAGRKLIASRWIRAHPLDLENRGSR